MPPVYRGATEQDFQAWEKLIDDGMPFYQAAQQVGVTMTALKKGDPVRAEQARELSKERQAAKVEKTIGRLVDESEPSPAVVNNWAKANHPDYADKTQLEITAKVEHEHRGVFAIGDLARAAEKMGLLEQLGFARSQGALPAAVEVPARRSEDAVGQSGDLPPARSA